MVSAAPSSRHALLVLGDLNVREEEVEELCDVCGVADAPYERTSWNPAVNQYHGEAARAGPGAHGHRFDRILAGGEAFAAVYLVGQSRFFRDGAEFYLSDHFGVLGLVDVHSDYSGRAGAAAARGRRQEVGRRRDQELLVEQQTALERQRVGRAEAALMRMRARDRDRGELLERLRRAQRQERERRQALHTSVFGAESLFDPGAESAFVASDESPPPGPPVGSDLLLRLPRG